MGQLQSYHHHRRRTNLGPIDILSEDALLAIFSYLPILDKISSARVCQKWNHLLQHPSVWRIIDLSQLNKHLKPLSSLDRKTAVLTFLKKYASHSTKHVRLMNFATGKILEFLSTTCAKLEGVSLFLHAGREDVDLALLSSKLMYIDLRFPINGGSGTCIGKFAAETPFCLLVSLNLHGVQITDALCNRLTHSQNLYHLTLFHCAFLDNSERHFMDLMSKLTHIIKIVLAYCWFSSREQVDDILHDIAVKCRKLKYFDFRFPYVPVDARGVTNIQDHEIAQLKFDNFLESMVDMDSLHVVKLCGIRKSGITPQGFETFLQHHRNIDTLELTSCCDVDDDILYSIACNLTELKTLQLRWCDNITNVGLKFLAHHPKLETLVLACSGVTGKAILYTVGTLPRIRELSISKIHGHKKCALMLKSQKPELNILY